MVSYKILNIVPLIFMSISVPIPFFFDYYSFLALSKVWKGYASSFVFLQSCSGNSGFFVAQYKFLELFVLVL